MPRSSKLCVRRVLLPEPLGRGSWQPQVFQHEKLEGVNLWKALLEAGFRLWQKSDSK